MQNMSKKLQSLQDKTAAVEKTPKKIDTESLQEAKLDQESPRIASGGEGRQEVTHLSQRSADSTHSSCSSSTHSSSRQCGSCQPFSQ